MFNDFKIQVSVNYSPDTAFDYLGSSSNRIIIKPITAQIPK